MSAPNFRGGCLLQNFGGVCSKFLGGSAPNFFWGVSAPNFRGGVCSKFLWGGVWSRGISNFRNTVNVRPVRFLLECILVCNVILGEVEHETIQ